MYCHKLQKDIEKLEQELGILEEKVDAATTDGIDKNGAVIKALEKISTIHDGLLTAYYHDIRIHNLNDSDHRNTEFLEHLNSLLPETKNPLPPETTIDEVRNNLEKYLEDDPRLDSNLLTFALQEKVTERLRALNKLNQTETLSSTKDQSNVHLQDIIEILKDIYAPILPKIEGSISNHAIILTILAERVKNLETYETKHYTFMLPKDKWDDNKIPLPENDEGAYIAPADLTAVLKEPVYFDWNYETNGVVTDPPDLVYDEKWVGREIRHFPWSKELFGEEGANENFLKPNGYHIVNDWDNIINAAEEQYRQANNRKPRLRETFEILKNYLRLGLHGEVQEDNLFVVQHFDSGPPGDYGKYWSAPRSVHSAYSLYLNNRQVFFSADVDKKSNGLSIRCATDL